MSSSMAARKEELLAKKARLAELKRQREIRQEQLGSGRHSLGGETPSPGKTTEQRRSEIDSLVSSLIDRERDSARSPSRSRPGSFYGAESLTPRDGEQTTKAPMVSSSTQTASADQVRTELNSVPAPPPSKPQPEYITYSKGVQTESYKSNGTGISDDVDEEDRPRTRRKSSRKQQEIDEEIRANLRKEIEEEMRATQDRDTFQSVNSTSQQRFPLRQLNQSELNAVTSSDDFVTFIERSSKVIERALDEEYDLLADYTRTAALDEDADFSSKTSQSLREIVQLYSPEYCRRRMVTDLQFSPHFPELLLTSYTKNPTAPNEPNGLCLLWNTHAPSRPEYVFNASSDVLTARFSPFHPNLIIGGCYNGQICIWDTRSSGSRNGQPERRTPPSGAGSHLSHTHPVFSLSIVGTPNAHNILTADTDGIVCSWSVDMLTQAQEYLTLLTPPPTKTDDLAPKSLSFPTADPTFFLVGSEEGSIFPCHRYDRAGAKAGVDNRLTYRGHTAPVMSTQFHPGRGPVELGDLLLSSSSDWTVKLWRVRPAAATTSAVTAATSTSTNNANASSMAASQKDDNSPNSVPPILDIPREDLVYDAKWSPNKPSVFACVTGAGDLEVYDLLYDIEVPVARATPSKNKLGLTSVTAGASAAVNSVLPFKGLNKLTWEERNGRQIAVGGLDGVVTLYEVGRGLSCAPGEAPVAEWQRMKAIVTRLESGL